MKPEDLGKFERNFIRAAAVLNDMEACLMWIGMSGNRNFEALKKDMLAHAGVTYRDITRDEEAGTP